MINELYQLLQLIWIILPIYTSNGAPVIASKIMNKLNIKRHPIDRGKIFIDGRRIFGDNKTWEGLLVGIITGFMTGVIQMFFNSLESMQLLYITRGTVMGLSAMIGDLLGAFIKRRLGLKSGEPLPILDQTTFFVIAIIVSVSLKLISITFFQFLYLLALTIVLHILTNYIAYKLKLKDVPW